MKCQVLDRVTVPDHTLHEASQAGLRLALVSPCLEKEEIVCGELFDWQSSTGCENTADDSPCIIACVTGSTVNDVALEWHDITIEDLDFTHMVKGTLTVSESLDWNALELQQGDLLVNGPLTMLLMIYRMWRTNELRELAHAHEIRIRVREDGSRLRQLLDEHMCIETCPTVIVMFRALRKPRTTSQVDRVREIVRDVPLTSGRSFTDIASDELRKEIMREWQDAVSTDRFQTSVCGPCGRRILSSKTTLVHSSQFDLKLLRNNGLPTKVDPVTYNFEAYDRAILAPKGLIDFDQPGDIIMCDTCRRDLVTRRRMPRLCLANWLYYAHEALPPDVKEAFDTSTYTDRLLLAHARASKISYRFSELRNSKGGGAQSLTEYARELAASLRTQKCIKGNVLVMPQDSTELTSVLPPPPEIVRDTVCAVFVGWSKPTKETLRNLGPMLVRKSRMLRIIQFIINDNAHYACDTSFHGFSQQNLDALFGPGTEEDDEGIPFGLDIGFIDDSDAIRSAMPDYTGRNSDEDDVLHGGTELLMENVGYTMGNDAAMSEVDMKMRALAHCLAGGRFV